MKQNKAKTTNILVYFLMAFLSCVYSLEMHPIKQPDEAAYRQLIKNLIQCEQLVLFGGLQLAFFSAIEIFDHF